ncbi:hypothetical protein MMC17_001691 [Xylographa soralifera]|nr:hypothetical protein [Xylographa soralifera]
MAQDSQSNNHLLGRNYIAATSLNAQHYIWNQQLGYNLHPDIIHPKDGAKIADVAAGTGMLLLEVARDYPNAQCDGFDISLAQCPPQIWLPNNVSLSLWDIFQEPPESFIGIYDIVHIRFLTLVIDHDPVPVINNIAKLLKPGGYLQWDEMDTTHSIVARVNDSVKIDATIRMDQLMKRRNAQSWIVRLAELLNQHGFENAQLHRVPQNFRYLKAQTDLHVLSFSEVAANIPEGDERKAEFTQLVADVFDESTKGAAHGCAKVVFVAQKISAEKC